MQRDRIIVVDLYHDQADRYALQWVHGEGWAGDIIGSEGWRLKPLKRSVETLTISLALRKAAIAWLTLVSDHLYGSRDSTGVFLFPTKCFALKARSVIYSRLRMDELRMRDATGSQDLRTADGYPWANLKQIGTI